MRALRREGRIRKFPVRRARCVRRSADRDLSLDDVEDLLDLGVVVRASIEARCDRELEQRALLGVFGRDQVVDPSLMQGDSVSLTVMQDNSLDGHLDLPFGPIWNNMRTS